MSTAGLVLTVVVLTLTLTFINGQSSDADSRPRRRVDACEGKTVELTCPRGYEVRIESASWGRGDASSCVQGANGNGNGLGLRCSLPAGKAAELVEGLCRGRRECRVSAIFAVFGNPCAQPTNKRLTVEYTCQQTLYTAQMCGYSGQLPLACPGNKLIQTQGAFFGREDINTTCPDLAAGHTLCASEAASQIVEELCDGKNECELDAIAEIFGNPCPSSYLKVNYTCAECSNSFGDDALCEYWALLGDCSTQADWMHSNCRKACSKCDDSVRCVNAHFNDTECDGWASGGQCEANPAYMYAFCKKSCLQCDKPTPCDRNKYDDFYAVSECQGWYDEGVCAANSGFALPQCTKSCFQCAENQNVRCENRYFDTALCEQFALEGECVSNPGWMYPNCLKACTGCSADPVCRNEVADSVCQGWFEDGQCAANPNYMYRFCWKACMQCEGPPACANAHLSDDDCEFWAMLGDCNTNPSWMIPNCQAACTRCRATPVQNCLNEGANDTQCDEWADQGFCQTNPTWMLPNCRKSCTWCDYFSSSLLQVGVSAVPGEASNFTRARSVILPDAVPVTARLTHFSAFFATRDPVWLQVWALTTSGTWFTVYSTRVVPAAAMSAQTIMVQGCTTLLPGDRVGFTSPGGVAPIGHTLQPDGVFQPTLVRSASSTMAFDSMGLPYAFSLSIGYDDVNLC